MAQQKPVNPFYVALLPMGVIFALSACSYTVMSYRGRDPQNALEGGLVGLMNQHGFVILAVELSCLAILTIAAIGTDDFWTRRLTVDKGNKANVEQQQ